MKVSHGALCGVDARIDMELSMECGLLGGSFQMLYGVLVVTRGAGKEVSPLGMNWSRVRGVCGCEEQTRLHQRWADTK